MGTIKGSLKHDLNLKSTSKKDDVSPPSVPDLQKLIQAAKGARKFSEKPRCDNPNQVDPSVNHDGIFDPANKNDGACPPTKPDNKAKRNRRFSEQSRPQNSTKVDPSCPSHFNEASSHVPELKKSQSTKLSSKKDLIAERKRQRGDVDSLLSSALIPSSTHHTKKKK